MKLLGINIFGDIYKALWDLAYDTFIKGPLYLLHGLGETIGVLSGQKIIDLIFKTKGNYFGIPKEFLIFLAIAGTLIVIFIAIATFKAIFSSNTGAGITSMFKRLIMVVLFIIFIPLFFGILNSSVIIIIKIVMPQFYDGQNFADMVGKLGFINNGSPNGWHYQDIPDYNSYSLFLGVFGTWFCLYIFFFLGLTLVKRLFDLFIFYVTGSVVFTFGIIDPSWQRVLTWKDLVIGRFISVLGVVLAVSVFMQLEPVILNGTDKITSNWIFASSLKLIFITGGAMACLESQVIFSAIIGSTVGLTDGIRMLTSAKIGGSAIKAGALGVVGTGKFLLWGRKNKAGLNGSTETNGMIKSLPNGAILKTASFVAKASVGGVLTAAGLITGAVVGSKTMGVKNTVKHLGTKAFKPVTTVSSLIKDKSLESFKKGAGKSTTWSTTTEIKNEMKNTLNNAETPVSIKQNLIQDTNIGSKEINKHILLGHTKSSYKNKPMTKEDKNLMDLYRSSERIINYETDSKGVSKQIDTTGKKWKKKGKK